MARSPLPTVFPFLAQERNRAVESALLEALPHLQPDAQAAALDLLIERNHMPTLVTLIQRRQDFDESLASLIVDRASDLAAALGFAVRQSSPATNEAAIDLIVQSNSGSLMYLLVEAIRSRCSETRELASQALAQLTGQHLGFGIDSDASAPSDSSFEDGLVSALAQAIRLWEVHLQPRALRAALWMARRLEPVIIEKLDARSSSFERAVCKQLEGSCDPRFAEFSLRALGIAKLRTVAAKTISRSQDPRFVRAVLMNCDVLADSRIEHGCRWIRPGRWQSIAIGQLSALDDRGVFSAVRFLFATGSQASDQAELIQSLMGLDSQVVRRAVNWRLRKDSRDHCTEALTLSAVRSGDRVAKRAEREVRRRRMSPAQLARSAYDMQFAVMWAAYDSLSDQEHRDLETAINRQAGGSLAFIRAKLASSEPLDRRRALQLAADLGLTSQMADAIHKAAHDPVPIVRSAATRLLESLPGTTSQRIARAAVNDADHRVQADALETLVRFEGPGWVDLSVSKLNAPSARVRANAIRSLLCAEHRLAGESLIEMLNDPSRSHRISALWVVERLDLTSVAGRIGKMARDDEDGWVRKRAASVENRLRRSGRGPLFDRSGKGSSWSLPTVEMS